MEVTIEFLKQLGLKVFEDVNPLLGTKAAGRKLERGAGGDISMHIDIIAEEIVIKTLEQAGLDLLLISEEVGEKFIGNKEKALQNQQKVIVDPVDGSNNSIRGIPFSCVSIAYAVGNSLDDILKAVIVDLNTKDIYWAVKGKGAYLNDEEIHVSENNISDECIIEIDYDPDTVCDDFTRYKSILEKIYRTRVMGSNALSFCLLAKGAIDAFLDMRPSNRLMDIAAGYLIVKEAGGKVFSNFGEDLKADLSINAEIPLTMSNANLELFLKKEMKKIEPMKSCTS